MKRLLALLPVLVFCLLCAPAALAAETETIYLDETGTTHTVTATVVTEEDSAWSDTTNGWYVVQGNVYLANRVTVTGDARLILENNAELNALFGIQLEGGNTLTIYAQSTGETMGKLMANGGASGNAGIGGNSFSADNSGALTINGGTVTATSLGGAGIGSGASASGDVGAVTINGGTVTATGYARGAGIGSGAGATGEAGTVTINGGTVTAESTADGAGIGSGGGGAGGADVTIAGGTVTATSLGGGAGIDAGSNQTVTISGGLVTATAAGTGSSGIRGKLATGENGNAVIFASSIEDDGLQEQWEGLIFNNTEGAVYGDSYTLAQDLEIPEDYTLTIGDGQTLTIPQNVTLTNNGTIVVDGGTLEYKVTGITLDQTELTLVEGGTAQLAATVKPENATDKTVTWASDNKAVATVDEKGLVTAIAAGNTTITATTEDGGKTAACTVTVTKKTYALQANPNKLDFGSVHTGYTQPAAQTVTLQNTGNQPLTVTLPQGTAYTVTGEAFASGTATIAADGAASFTVQPKAGLAAGTYSETLTVTATGVEGQPQVTAAITLAFTVQPAPTPMPTATPLSREQPRYGQLPRYWASTMLLTKMAEMKSSKTLMICLPSSHHRTRSRWRCFRVLPGLCAWPASG